MPAAPLTAAESRRLAGLMLDLAEQGEHETNARLGELAADPDAVRQVLAGLDDDQGGDDE